MIIQIIFNMPWVLIFTTLIFRYFYFDIFWQLNEYISLPNNLAIIFAVIQYFIWFFYGYYLYSHHEYRFAGNGGFSKSVGLWWIDHKTFINRYSHAKLAPFWYSAFLTSAIYSIGISLTLAALEILRTMNFKSLTDGINVVTYIHTPGTIVTYIIAIMGINSLVNTEIIKRKMYRPIEQVTELLDTLTYEVRSEGYTDDGKPIYPRLKKYGDLFFYIFDHTIATGHISVPERKRFTQYVNALGNYLANNDVKFRGIVYDRKILDGLYTKLLKRMTDNPDSVSDSDILNRIIDSHDAMICKLNRIIRDKNGTDNDKFVKYVKQWENVDELDAKLTCTWLYDGEITNHIKTSIDSEKKEFTESQNIISNVRDIQAASEKKAGGVIVPVLELGLTRFIVSNTFLIQFIATKSDHKGNLPAGFYTEDIILIERYKSAFEDYWKCVAEKEAPRQMLGSSCYDV